VAFPEPKPGLVIRYAFLWHEAAARGQEEGDKDRPCAIVMTTRNEGARPLVLVLPVTHSPPSDPDLAVEIPAQTKRRLGLDDQRSWIMVTDANRFLWPGPDLRPREPGVAESVVYGYLPASVFNAVRDKLAHAIASRLSGIVPRTE